MSISAFFHTSGGIPAPPPVERAAGGRQTLASGAGALELRLAATKGELSRAQKLRYRVFFREGAGRPDAIARMAARDICPFDAICDHLIGFDASRRTREGAAKIAGVARLLRDDVAARNFGFACAREFDVARMIARHPGKRFLELGRFCIAPAYRSGGALDLLWRGIFAYARQHGIDVVFGCASLPGADAKLHAGALRTLSDHCRASEIWRVRAADGRAAALPGPAPARASGLAALRGLPPLLKGYLSAGAHISPEAVIDAAFGVTDVFVVMPIAEIGARYRKRFEAASPVLAAA